MQITIPKYNLMLEPNMYDKIAACNGCGNHFTTEVLGINVNLVFLPACRNHDFNCSEFSNMEKGQADDIFYTEMIDIIVDGDFGFISEELLEWVALLYRGLVEVGGGFSFQEFNRFSIPPSLVVGKDKKLQEIECISVAILISDDTYVYRWYTREEAWVLGLI